MILNCFNVLRFLENRIKGVNGIDIVDYSINCVKMSINDLFEAEILSEDIKRAFPQGNFNFEVVESELYIDWY